MQFIKLFEDINKARSILKNKSIFETDPDFIKIRELLKKNPGYIGFFTHLRYEKNNSVEDLIEFFDVIQKSQSQINKFPKPLIKYDTIEEVIDEIEKLKLDSSIHHIYSEFPKLQKSFIKTKQDSDLLSQLSKRKDSSTFFRKIASYKNRKDLIEGLKNFLKVDPNAKANDIIKKCKEIGSDVIYYSEEKDVLVVRVYSASEIRILAGDSAWCIKNDATFKSYVYDKTCYQFILFLLNREDLNRKIGITYALSRTDSDPFQTAHNINDGSVSQENLSKLLSEYGLNLSIFINKNTIDMQKASVFILLKYGWTKQEIIKNKNSYKPNDLNQFSKEEIEKWNLLDKSEITREKLKEYSDEEILNKNLLLRCNQFYLNDIINYITNPKFEKFVRENISKLYYEKRFNKIVSGGKPEIISDTKWKNKLDNFKVGEKRIFSDRDDQNKYSLELTLFNLIWNNVTSKDCTLYEVSEIVESDRDGFSEYEIKPIFQTIRYMGFDLDDEKTILKFLTDIRSYDCDAYKSLKKLGYEKYRDIFFKNWEDNKHYFRDYNFDKLKGFLTSDQLSAVKEVNDVYDYNQEIERLFRNKYPYESECKEFYNKWKTHVQRWDKLDRFNKSYNKITININTILLYSKLDKLDELKKLEFPLWGNTNFIGKLSECISYPTNKKEPFEYFLSIEQRKKIYFFITSMNLEDINRIDYHGGGQRRYRRKEYYYQDSMFIFDRDSFNDYVEEVSHMKNNCENYNYSDGGFKNEKFITLRIKELQPTLIFLYKTNQKEECIKLASKIASWDMKIPELKATLDMWSSVDYIASIFAKKYYNFTKSSGVKSKLSKYIITEWVIFKI